MGAAGRVLGLLLVVSVVVAAVLAAFWVYGVGSLGDRRNSGAHGPATNGTPAEPYSVISYTSSVDGAPLTYREWVPPTYSANRSTAFLLFLHGQTDQSDNGCGEFDNRSGGISMLNAALAQGWLAGSLCTRTGDGWYVNSPYSGPQETDVLDAIAHERAIRNVSSVYLVGFSMGTSGALNIADHHPGLVAGVGVIEACPDEFMTIDYLLASAQAGKLYGFEAASGGPLPSDGGYARGLAYYLSSFRFFPQNMTGVRLYVVEGGMDITCPNNVSTFGFQQGNNTVLNATCLVAAAEEEPSGCTTPFAGLSDAHARLVFEPLGHHSIDNVYGPDLVGYLAGDEPDGTYWAAPGEPPGPAP
ncbi:MAG TPA: alpha/beta hydrolase [Thermoplasmata archaeon]|nr:alpha/beta hydrolase [Thermoplasmata archaeon]